MSKLPLVREQDADSEVVETYKDVKRGLQIPFVPNFFKAQASSAEVLSTGWQAVRNILVDGKYVPRTVKEMIFVAISQVRECHHCETTHLALCKLLDLDEEMTNALSNDLDALVPRKTRDIVRFAIKVAVDPKRLEDSDYATVRRHGVSDAELTEIVSMAALTVYANTIAEALKIEVDREFQDILQGRPVNKVA